MSNMKYDAVFRIAASLFLIAALYHVAGLLDPDLVLPSPRWRHGVFVVVNITGIWLILRRPFWVVYPFSVVTAQQIYSHSRRIWTWWNSGHRIDWISIAVVVVLPLVLGLVFMEARERKNRRNGSRLSQQ